MRPVPSWRTRIRWRLQDLWAEQDARIVIGLVVLALLALGGVAAARAVARASATSSARTDVRVVTVRQKVRVREHGRLVTRWRTRKVYARAHTVLQTQTIRTPHGLRVVTHPIVRYRVTYRKHVVTRNGKTRTVLQPVTNTKTQVVTSTRQVTDKEVSTVTQPVTTTVVSTETDTVAVTVTVTVPTVTIP